jgi:hypothetical protein
MSATSIGNMPIHACMCLYTTNTRIMNGICTMKLQEHAEIAVALHDLAEMLLNAGRSHLAVAIGRRGGPMARRLLGPRHAIASQYCIAWVL